MRTSFFLHKMCNNSSPVELKNCFILKDKPDSSYNLRSNNHQLITTERTYSRFGDLTFKNFVSHVVNKLSCVNLYSNFNIFKTGFLENINKNYCKFVKLFKKFDLTLEFYFFRN